MIQVNGNTYFACDECPIVQQLDRRLALEKEFPDSTRFQFDHCSCDKVSDEFFACGYCEDAWVTLPPSNTKGKRKTGYAYRQKMARKKKKRLIEQCEKFYCGCWVDDNQKLHFPKNSKESVYWRKHSNRAVRRYNGDIQKGSWYKKIFDYKWQTW